MKLSSKILVITSMVASMTALTVAAFAHRVKAVNEVSMTFTAAGKHRVTFYTSYTDSWGGITYHNITDGDKITASNIPNVSLSGYTLLGWISNVPTTSNYNVDVISNSDLANVTVTSDLTYYPIVESDDELAYVDGHFYPLSTDVIINASSIGTTKIGTAYLGINDIPSPTADWVATRQLTTTSGIYQFSKSAGAAVISRKIGLSTEDDTCEHYGNHAWKASDFNTQPRKVWSQVGSSGDGGYEYTLTRVDETERFYAYVDYTYTRFYFKNYSYYDGSNPAESGAIDLSDGYSSTNWILHKTGNYLSSWTVGNSQAEWGV